MKKVMKKVASVIVLTLGTICIYTFLFASILQGVGQGSIDPAMFFFLIGIPLIFGGTALWGWTRWKIVIGIILTVMGGIFALMVVNIPVITKANPAFFNKGTVLLTIELPLAIGFLLAGITLIILQKRRDRTSQNKND
jgi:peptidoglycan/LPS O-acetylase OafA/YrhL